MAFFYLKIDGMKTPCFVTQGQTVENLEDLAVTPERKEEFIETLTAPAITHNTLIKIAAALDVLPDDARKATKEDYAKVIYNKLAGKKPLSSASSSSRDKKKKKKKKKETSSESETSSGEERRKARKAQGKKQVDKLTAAFDSVAIEGQSISTMQVETSED